MQPVVLEHLCNDCVSSLMYMRCMRYIRNRFLWMQYVNILPVLKHGLRSLMCVRVRDCDNSLHNKCNRGHIGCGPVEGMRMFRYYVNRIAMLSTRRSGITSVDFRFSSIHYQINCEKQYFSSRGVPPHPPVWTSDQLGPARIISRSANASLISSRASSSKSSKRSGWQLRQFKSAPKSTKDVLPSVLLESYLFMRWELHAPAPRATCSCDESYMLMHGELQAHVTGATCSFEGSYKLMWWELHAHEKGATSSCDMSYMLMRFESHMLEQ